MCPQGSCHNWLHRREDRNSRVVGFSDLFSGMFAAAHALIHSWQTFTFYSWAGVLHLNEVFNVCCFACFKEDSSICLMCETAERCLSRIDFWWWSTTTVGETASRKKMWLAKKAKFNTSYLITSWILRCNWIGCIKPTLLFPSVKHKFSTMWHISVFIITCTCIIILSL